MSTIAILGAGAMGSRMAKALLRAGHDITVYNRSPERAEALVADGAVPALTPRVAAAHADIVIAMVADDHASRAVWLDEETGAADGLRVGAIAIESSTLTPRWTRELAMQITERGAAFLDAPVVGSRPQADVGQLVYLVGGVPATVTRAIPILDAMGGSVHHVGPVGQGMMLKLVVNALFAIQIAAVGELVSLLRKTGMDTSAAVRVIGGLPVTSPAVKGAAALMLARDFAPLFPIDLVEKDLRYLMEAAGDGQAWVPTTTAVRDLYAHAQELGYGSDHIAGIAQLFQ